MKTDLTSEQVEQSQRDGFLLIEGFLEPDELRTWIAVTEDAVRQRLEKIMGRTL